MDALGSGFLEELRRHHGQLTEAKGGCALRTNREWAASVLRGSRGGGYAHLVHGLRRYPTRCIVPIPFVWRLPEA